MTHPAISAPHGRRSRWLPLLTGLAVFAGAYLRAERSDAAHRIWWEGKAAQFRGDSDGALRRFAEAGDLDAGRMIYPISQADLEVKSGRPDSAEIDLRKVIARDPGNPAARRGLGYCNLLAGRTQEARLEFERVLLANPDDSYARMQLVHLDLESGRFAVAAERLADRFESPDANYDELSLLAFCHTQLNRMTDAVELYRRAVGLRPDSAGAQSNLILALIKSDQREEAARSLREALGRWPADARLNALRGRSATPLEAPR